MYVTFQYSEQETIVVSIEEVLKGLMFTPRGIPEPYVGKQDLADFPTDLYNFLLRHYTDNDLDVVVSSIPLLADLSRAIRDLLQTAHSRINP